MGDGPDEASAGPGEVNDGPDEAIGESGGDGPPAGAPDREDTLAELFAVVEDRKERLPEGSYTAALLTHERGENAVLEKLGEETTELVLAAKDDDPGELAHEAADVVYHLLVLLSMKGMDLTDLEAELEARR